MYTAVYFAASCTAYIDNAMLVVGSQASDYAPLHPADDLARCLRYYETIGDGNADVAVAGYCLAGAGMQWYIPYKARKPVSPTITKIGTWAVANSSQPTILAGQCFGGHSMQIIATATGSLATASPNGTYAVTVEANP